MWQRAHPWPDRRQRGGAAVEFAIVMPLFLTMVMGSIDFGYFFFSDQVVTNAAREGARSGSLVDLVSGNWTPVLDAAESSASNYMSKHGICCPGGCLSYKGCVKATQTKVSGYDAVQLEIKYDAPRLTGFTPAAIFPALVKAVSTMRVN